MSKQLQFFSNPFRETYRRRERPRLNQMRTTKKRKTMQAVRRRKTAQLTMGSEGRENAIAWSPEQLDRIWRNTAG